MMDKMRNQLVVPVTLRPHILLEYHDSLVRGGHQGLIAHTMQLSQNTTGRARMHK